jgi:hypothetical protein
VYIVQVKARLHDLQRHCWHAEQAAGPSSFRPPCVAGVTGLSRPHMSSNQQPPTGLPVGALAVGTWWRTGGTNCAAPPPTGPTPQSTPRGTHQHTYAKTKVSIPQSPLPSTGCGPVQPAWPRVSGTVRRRRLPSTVIPDTGPRPAAGPDQKKRAAERSMLFLRCQPRVSSPSASAPPFRPRVGVAATLGVRVTGGRRGQAVVAMASADARLAGIASSIRVIPDFPKPGGFTPDFRTIVPHLTSLSVSTTLLLYRSRGWTTGRWMSGRE